jgi:hypothetical protein
MAPRTVKIRHDSETRAKIKASQLLNRLQDHVFKDGVKLSQTQMKAIEILLRKCLPDLQAIELTGQDGAPIEMNMNVNDAERIKALGVFLAKTGAKPQ